MADVRFDDLGRSVVLIGANGSGKSNLIRFFEMLSWMLRSRSLGEFVERQGGADDQLFGGRAATPTMEAEIRLCTDSGRNDYWFALAHAHPDRFFFSKEAFRFSKVELPDVAQWQYLGSGHREAEIVEAAQGSAVHAVNYNTARVIVSLLKSCAVYQFHNTSDTSGFKKKWDINSYSNHLYSHGGNLAAVLYRVEQEDLRRYEWICRQINRVLPTFDRFSIDPNYGKAFLSWKVKGQDKVFGAHLTSDGSLRSFALVTLLNLPPEMLPQVLLLDEPELGLHPAAVSLVGAMIKSLSTDRQVIVATQSPLLVDSFDIDEIIVLNLKEGRTEPIRANRRTKREWLEEYTAGELWQKNLLGGHP